MIDHILGYDAEGIFILKRALAQARSDAQGFRELQTKYTNLEIEYAKARQEIEVLAPYRDAFHHMQAKMAGVELKKPPHILPKNCPACGGNGRCSDMGCHCLTDKCAVCSGRGTV